MDFVIHHVLQALVIGRANEDLGCDFSTSEAIVEDLKKSMQSSALLPITGTLKKLQWIDTLFIPHFLLDDSHNLIKGWKSFAR